jgi:threonine/homoserine/homoserine lactone efflux protein
MTPADTTAYAAALCSVLGETATTLSLEWEPLRKGILLGIGAAMPIGPVNVQIARRVLRYGFWSGAALGFGAVTVDVAYALLSAFSFTHVFTQPTILRVVGVLGLLLLTYLGVQCLRAGRSAWRKDPLAATDDAAPPAVPTGGESRRARLKPRIADYVTGLLMTLLNPITLLFWFVVLPTTGAAIGGGTTGGGDNGIAKAATANLPMIAVGVFIGTLSWVFAFGTLLATASVGIGAAHERRRKWLAVADIAGGVTLLGFAVAAAWRTFGA